MQYSAKLLELLFQAKVKYHSCPMHVLKHESLDYWKGSTLKGLFSMMDNVITCECRVVSIHRFVVVFVLDFYVPQTATVIQRRDLH